MDRAILQMILEDAVFDLREMQRLVLTGSQ
jgi:hypothetical protein